MTCIIVPMGTAMDAHKCKSMGTAVRCRTALINLNLMVSVDVTHRVYSCVLADVTNYPCLVLTISETLVLPETV